MKDGGEGVPRCGASPVDGVDEIEDEDEDEGEGLCFKTSA